MQKIFETSDEFFDWFIADIRKYVPNLTELVASNSQAEIVSNLPMLTSDKVDYTFSKIREIINIPNNVFLVYEPSIHTYASRYNTEKRRLEIIVPTYAYSHLRYPPVIKAAIQHEMGHILNRDYKFDSKSHISCANRCMDIRINHHIDRQWLKDLFDAVYYFRCQDFVMLVPEEILPSYGLKLKKHGTYNFQIIHQYYHLNKKKQIKPPKIYNMPKIGDIVQINKSKKYGQVVDIIVGKAVVEEMTFEQVREHFRGNVLASNGNILGNFTAEQITIINPPQEKGAEGQSPQPNEPEDNSTTWQDPDDKQQQQPQGGEGESDDESEDDNDDEGSSENEDSSDNIDERIKEIDKIIEDLKGAGVSDNQDSGTGEEKGADGKPVFTPKEDGQGDGSQENEDGDSEKNGKGNSEEPKEGEGEEGIDGESKDGEKEGMGEDSDSESKGKVKSQGKEGSEESVEGIESKGKENKGKEQPSKQGEEGDSGINGKKENPIKKRQQEILKDKLLEVEIRKKIVSLKKVSVKTNILNPYEITEINNYIKELENLL